MCKVGSWFGSDVPFLVFKWVWVYKIVGSCVGNERTFGWASAGADYERAKCRRVGRWIGSRWVWSYEIVRRIVGSWPRTRIVLWGNQSIVGFLVFGWARAPGWVW